MAKSKNKDFIKFYFTKNILPLLNHSILYYTKSIHTITFLHFRKGIVLKHSQQYIDLHSHSNASDGSLSPSALVREALKKQLSHLALTDHDTMDGVPEAFAAADGTGLQLIPGVEMSCVYGKKEIHILGYLFRFSGNMQDLVPIMQDLEMFAVQRHERNLEILARLRADGYDIEFEELKLGQSNTQITRAHFATVLMQKAYVSSRKAAFDSILADGSKYIPHKKNTPAEICRFFRRHGLFFSLAHPYQYGFSHAELEELLRFLQQEGMQGLEVYHSTHHPGEARALQLLADRLGLFYTGGSDFHGDNKPGLELGTGYASLRVPADILFRIWEQSGHL